MAFPTQPVVTVEDADGNTVTSSAASITLAIGTNPSGGTLTCTANPKNAVNGVDAFAGCNINLAGNGYTLTASATGLTGATSSPFNVAVGPAARLVFTQQPTNTAAGSSITPAVTVSVEDAGADVVTTSTASIGIAIGTNPGGGTLSGTTPVNAVNGVATFSNLSINKTGTGYILSATSSGLTTATSSTFNITPGTATQLVFTTEPSTPDTAGVAFGTQPRVTVEDANNNPVTTAGTPVTLAITSGTGTAGATLTCTTNPVNTAGTGIATFAGCSINLAGTNYTLTATSGSLTAGISNAITVNAGAATKLVFGVQPSNTQFSTPIAPSVTVLVEDAGGDVINSSASITMAIGTNPSGGTLSGTLTVAAVNGTATFSNLSINNIGVGYTLHATATGLTAVTSSAFNITAGPPTKLIFGVQPSNTAVGATITPAVTVQVEDAGGHVVTTSTASVSMGFGANPGSGTLSGTTTVNAVSGVATFSTLSVTVQGIGYSLSASSSGLTGATSSTFNITAPQVTYIQPFNAGHNWGYTQTSCNVGTLFGNCNNSAAATTNCASSPGNTGQCVDAGVLVINSGGTQTGYFQNPVGYTWQTLGVPANTTVLSVQGAWYDASVLAALDARARPPGFRSSIPRMRPRSPRRRST